MAVRTFENVENDMPDLGVLKIPLSALQAWNHKLKEKEKGMAIHPLYVSCHLFQVFHLLRFNHHNFTIPLAPSTHYKDVRLPSYHSGEFVVTFRLSLFINITLHIFRTKLGTRNFKLLLQAGSPWTPLESSDEGWSRVAWKPSTRSDAERICEGVWVVYNASRSNLIFVKNSNK